MSTVPSSSADLAEEIKQLESDLRTAEAARITPEDRHAQEIRDHLAKKKQELEAQQATEDQAKAEQARQRQLALLAEMKRDIDHAKSETIALRSMLAELPAKLSRAKYRLNELLRQHALLKTDLGI